MLSPKRVKRRKVHRGNMPGNATRCNSVVFGDFGLVALDRMWITNRQLEAARIAINRHVKRGGKMWIRIFPDKPYSKKPAETRMGKGKGAPEYWVAVVKTGTVMFELGGGITRVLAEEAMTLAGSKLPIKTKFVARSEMELGA
jgi:large subunit ribosomal protein L16